MNKKVVRISKSGYGVNKDGVIVKDKHEVIAEAITDINELRGKLIDALRSNQSLKIELSWAKREIEKLEEVEFEQRKELKKCKRKTNKIINKLEKQASSLVGLFNY